MTVDQEIRTRVAKAMQAHPQLTALDAERLVLNADPALYQRYVQDASTAPERTPPSPRLSAAPMGAVESDVMQRIDARIAKSAGLSYAEAASEVFRDDADLYAAYCQEASGARAAVGPEPPPPPVVKHPLADDIERLALTYHPDDLGAGLVKVRYALGELRKIAVAKIAARQPRAVVST